MSIDRLMDKDHHTYIWILLSYEKKDILLFMTTQMGVDEEKESHRYRGQNDGCQKAAVWGVEGNGWRG